MLWAKARFETEVKATCGVSNTLEDNFSTSNLAPSFLSPPQYVFELDQQI